MWTWYTEHTKKKWQTLWAVILREEFLQEATSKLIFRDKKEFT